MNIIFLDPKYWKVGFASLPYNVKGNEYPKALKTWCEELKADIVWNLAAFNFASAKNIASGVAGRTVHYLKVDGTDRGYGDISTPITIGPNANNQVSGYAYQTVGIDVVNNEIQKGVATGKTSRNLHGITASGKYIIVQTEKATEATACRSAINRAVSCGEVIKTLLTEDGGGSVGQYCRNTKMLYAPQKEGTDGRKVASVVYANYIGPEITRVLKKGCKGLDVAILQTMLCIDPDGSFGPGTEKALKQAQFRLGLTADGSCGPKTAAMIFKMVA